MTPVTVPANSDSAKWWTPFQHLVSVVVAVVREDGQLTGCNAGFQRLLSMRGDAQSSDVTNFFILPRFERLVATLVDHDQVIHSGVLNVGDNQLACHSLIGTVRRDGLNLIVVAEFDVAEMEMLNAQVIQLNEQLTEAQRKLARQARIQMRAEMDFRKLTKEELQHSYTQLRQLSDHQETIKEEERRRIAIDIHDDLGQNLMVIKIDVEMLQSQIDQTNPKLSRQVQRLLDTTDVTIKSIRSIINDLHPSVLELGLCAAVELHLKQCERRNAITCKLIVVDGSANASLDNRQTAAIFRIIQESLANVVRHAQASEVEVSLNFTSELLTIVIADNGIGMVLGGRSKIKSFGLKGIKERINAFGGELIIDSRKGEGTTLSILIPATAMLATG